MSFGTNDRSRPAPTGAGLHDSKSVVHRDYRVYERSTSSFKTWRISSISNSASSSNVWTRNHLPSHSTYAYLQYRRRILYYKNMIFIINVLVLIWSLATFRKLSQSDKTKSKKGFLLTNLLNLTAVALCLANIVWATAVTPSVPPLENPIMYEPTGVHVVAFFVFAFCVVVALIGIYNIRHYSAKRRGAFLI